MCPQALTTQRSATRRAQSRRCATLATTPTLPSADLIDDGEHLVRPSSQIRVIQPQHLTGAANSVWQAERDFIHGLVRVWQAEPDFIHSLVRMASRARLYSRSGTCMVSRARLYSQSGTYGKPSATLFTVWYVWQAERDFIQSGTCMASRARLYSRFGTYMETSATLFSLA